MPGSTWCKNVRGRAGRDAEAERGLDELRKERRALLLEAAALRSSLSESEVRARKLEMATRASEAKFAEAESPCV